MSDPFRMTITLIVPGLQVEWEALPSAPAPLTTAGGMAPEVSAPMHRPPYGYCHCGCGRKTQIVTESRRAKGLVKGQPRRFINGHSSRRDLVERFWAKVDKNPDGGCWCWTSTTTRGYGTFNVDGKHLYAHRVSYEMNVGNIPKELELDHLCRNRACVNPAHLEPVTRFENVRRSRICKLTMEQADEIRGSHLGSKRLADEYGVSCTAIQDVRAGRTWVR